MQIGLEIRISEKDWMGAAVTAINLSSAHLNIGDLPQALTYAQQGAGFADRSSDTFQSMISKITLACIFHQSGHLSEAERAFVEAESMQSEAQPEFLILYSVQGFEYCDLLLYQKKYQEVRTRASQTLAWVKPAGLLLAIALDCLSIGRANLLQAQREAIGDFSEATEYLIGAVNGLRQAGNLPFLPIGLLARAELCRVKGEFERAQDDLDEAMRIATRGSMGLHEADCHLEYARLYLARGEREKAGESWAVAKEMIERMGYHRRDRDLAEIEEQLTGGKPV